MYDEVDIASYAWPIGSWFHIWQRCRDALAGQDAVRFRHEYYLPRPPGMKDAEVYAFYLRNATWFDATARTMRGLHGTLFRKPPYIPDLTEQYRYRMADFDGQGSDFLQVAKTASWEQLLVGRYGLLVSGPLDSGQPAMATPWFAEQIMECKESVMPTGERKLTRLKLVDTVPGMKRHTRRLRVIVLELDQQGKLVVTKHLANEATHVEHFHINPYSGHPFPFGPNVYLNTGISIGSFPITEFSQLYELSLPITEFTQESVEYPTRMGERLDFIPFVLFQPSETRYEQVIPPPIRGLVDENFAHYIASASYERGRYRLSDPMVAIFDSALRSQMQSGETVEVKAGGDRFLVFNTGGDAKIIGMDPEALKALKDPMELRREQMVLLGSRLLETPRKLVEATKTHEIRMGSENATLVDIAEANEHGMNRVLEYILWWQGESDQFIADNKCTMARDFVPSGLDPNLLRELVKAWLDGAISKQTMLHNLKQNEGLPHNRTIEEELSLIEKDEQERQNRTQMRQNPTTGEE